MQLHGVLADSFTDKRQKGTELRSAKAVPWTVVTGTALLSDPRREERERRQNAITTTTTATTFIHIPQRCVGSITWSVGAQGKGQGKGAPVHTVKVGLQGSRGDTAPVIFIRETRNI